MSRRAVIAKHLGAGQPFSVSAAADLAYEERAIMVIAVARMAMREGCRVWFAVDPQEPAWPVLYVELPTGQVSWHFSAEQRRDLGDGISDGPNAWDGHATDEKYDRLLAWSER